MSKHHPMEKIGGLHIPEAAMQKLIAERDFERQQHLDELNKGQAVEGSAINAVVLAQIQFSGVPDERDQPAIYAACKSMAKLISDDQLKRRAEKIKELLVELNMHQAPKALIWACKQAGVELFPADPRDTADDAANSKPALVEH